MTAPDLRPRARSERLLTETLESGEVVVYDLDSDRAHCLNPAASAIWRHCDGGHTVSDLARHIGEALSLSADAADLAARVAVDELHQAGLLEQYDPQESLAPGIDRREMIRRLGIGASVAVMVPAIMSIVAPTPAAAASQLPSGACVPPGGSSIDCASKMWYQDGTCLSGYRCL